MNSDGDCDKGAHCPNNGVGRLLAMVAVTAQAAVSGAMETE